MKAYGPTMDKKIDTFIKHTKYDPTTDKPINSFQNKEWVNIITKWLQGKKAEMVKATNEKNNDVMQQISTSVNTLIQDVTTYSGKFLDWMVDIPDAVCIYIPLMKDLGMSWQEIKTTPRVELQGLLESYQEYNVLHSFDGYTAEDVGVMAKDKPRIRSQYNKYVEARRRLKAKTGQVQKPKSFKEMLGS